MDKDALPVKQIKPLKTDKHSTGGHQETTTRKVYTNIITDNWKDQL